MIHRDKNASKGPIPQHSVLELGEVVIRSDFDSGNIARAEQMDDYTLHLWTGPDCMGTHAETSCRTWFYFHMEAPVNSTFTLTIKNLNLQGKLFREGMKPVFKTESSDWQRIDSPVSCNVAGDVGNRFEITFQFTFHLPGAFFAFTYPWSYSDCLAFNKSLQKSCKEIYFHKETLIRSIEGRKCEILTISSHKGMSPELESHISALFPNRKCPPHKFTKKPIVFISARVHPGETCASFAANGFLKFITSQDPRAQVLRDEFVFKVVPMINPDGVFRGYYRTDTQGLNLNRFYNNPSLHQHPCIYAIKELIHSFQTYEGGLYAYIDMHAHASKRACFMYGNNMDFNKQIEAVLLAKLMKINCPNFDFEGSNFSEFNMTASDGRDGLSKEGSGRVAFYRMTGNPRCYTLECNYNSGHFFNKVRKTKLPESQEGDSTSEVYAHGPPAYTREIFENVGSSLAVSILDSIDKNPHSRMRLSLGKLRYEVATYICRSGPFAIDRGLKRVVNSFESFEEYVKASKKTESRNARRKPPRMNTPLSNSINPNTDSQKNLKRYYDYGKPPIKEPTKLNTIVERSRKIKKQLQPLGKNSAAQRSYSNKKYKDDHRKVTSDIVFPLVNG